MGLGPGFLAQPGRNPHLAGGEDPGVVLLVEDKDDRRRGDGVPRLPRDGEVTAIEARDLVAVHPETETSTHVEPDCHGHGWSDLRITRKSRVMTLARCADRRR